MFNPDIPFSRDDANRFLPWMIALMCCITALMLCVGLTLGHWVHGREGQVASGFTVQVPPQGDKNTQVVRQVMAALQNTPGVQSVRLLTTDEVHSLVEPWLGAGAAVQALPLPSVIEGQAVDGIINYQQISTQLRAIAPDIAVDTQEIWAEKFARLSAALQGIAYALAAIIGGALAGVMVFAARAAMRLHADAVTLLHAIGAEDRYIARQFQANALSLALRGAVPGTLVAGGVYALFGAYAARLDAPLMPDLTLRMPHLLMLGLLPVCCCIISMFAVRLATLAQIKLLP